MNISRFKTRLDKLEEDALGSGLEPPVIVVSFMQQSEIAGPVLKCDPVTAEGHGLTWHRDTNESAEAFRERVLAEVPREKGRATVIIMLPEGVKQNQNKSNA